MRGFGWMFVGLGYALAGVSAKAISDPTSPIGWNHWTDDPWSQGVIVGVILAVVGTGMLVANRRLSARAKQRAAEILWVLVAGAVGFLMFAPFVAVGFCVHTATGGYCRDQEWSTALGLTFEGSPSPLPGLIAGTVAAILVSRVGGRIRRRRGRVDVNREPGTK